MNDTDIKTFYNSVDEDVARDWYGNDSLLPTIKEFLSFLPPKPKIPDLGCGPGHEAKRMAKLGAEVTGIDLSGKSIEIAKRETPECTFIEMNYSDIDESLGSFDGIFSAGSLIHIPADKLTVTLKHIVPVLKNNGYFLAIIREGEDNFVHYPEIDGRKIERILYRFTKKEIQNCFHRAGMNFVKKLILTDELLQSSWKAYMLNQLNN